MRPRRRRRSIPSTPLNERTPFETEGQTMHYAGSIEQQDVDVAALRATLEGTVVTPADEQWNEARQAWNLAVDQQPELVVLAESAEDVASTVAFGVEKGLRVAPQGTGHNASALGPLDGAVLLKTSRMQG